MDGRLSILRIIKQFQKCLTALETGIATKNRLISTCWNINNKMLGFFERQRFVSLQFGSGTVRNFGHIYIVLRVRKVPCVAVDVVDTQVRSTTRGGNIGSTQVGSKLHTVVAQEAFARVTDHHVLAW